MKIEQVQITLTKKDKLNFIFLRGFIHVQEIFVFILYQNSPNRSLTKCAFLPSPSPPLPPSPAPLISSG